MTDDTTIKLRAVSGVASVGKVREALQRMNESDVNQFNEYEQRIADLETQLAEAQRREGLLRAVHDRVLIGGNHLASCMLTFGAPAPFNYDRAEDIPAAWMRDVWIAWRAIMDLSETIAAIDGGAMGE